MRFIDITNKRYGKLIVLREYGVHPKRKVIMWECKCDCGNIKIVAGIDLKVGNTTSCGCMSSRKIAGERNKTHGMSNTHIYAVWRTMKDRCNNPKNKSFKDYGGKGICVCERWNKFEYFYEDMYETYSEGLSIDRKNCFGNYEPYNCRWVNRKIQNNNKTNNHIIEIEGFTGNVTEACSYFGIPTSTFYRRIKRGMSIEQIFKTKKENII